MFVFDTGVGSCNLISKQGHKDQWGSQLVKKGGVNNTPVDVKNSETKHVQKIMKCKMSEVVFDVVYKTSDKCSA